MISIAAEHAENPFLVCCEHIVREFIDVNINYSAIVIDTFNSPESKFL